MQEVWALFDRDTATRFRASSGTRVRVSLGERSALYGIKTFGASPNTLRVLDAGGSHEIARIDLRSREEERWSVHRLDGEDSPAEVVLAIEGQGGEVGDIELWGAHAPFPLAYAPHARPEAKGDRPAIIDTIASTTDTVELGNGVDSAHPACGALRFELPRHPGAYRRMWLRFSITGAFRPFVLTHALNSHDMIRGHYLPGGGTGSYVQPIDPELLFVGTNEAHFCAPEELERTIAIGNVEIVGELDAGSNFVESATVAPYDAMPTRGAMEILADRPVPVTLAAGEELVFAFDRLIAIDALELVAAEPSTWSVRCVDDENAKHTLTFEDVPPEAAVFAPAVRAVSSGGERCAGVRIGRQLGGTIERIRVHGSGAARRIDFPQIVLASPREHFGHAAWVEGWAR
ncbi:MAG: hypothetical protein H5U40_11665, partial [Polyangiaceae bacterium]|nr:hypothetical protein [Polyangiaceae bacterium]